MSKARSSRLWSVAKALLFGIACELLLLSPLLIWGWGHGIPATALGWIPYVVHAPAFIVFTSIGLRDYSAAIVSTIAMAGLWSLLAYLIPRFNRWNTTDVNPPVSTETPSRPR